MQLHHKEKMDGKFLDVMTKVAGSVSSATVGGLFTGLALGPVGILVGAASGALANSVMESSLTKLLKKGMISSKDAGFLSNLLPYLLTAFIRGTDEPITEIDLDTIATTFYEAMVEAIHFNSYILDNIVDQLCSEMKALDIEGAKKVLERLITL
jgi:hypothetical protein